MINLNKQFPKKLSELAALCDAQVIGDADYPIIGVCSVENQQPQQLTFLGSDKLINQIDAETDCAYIVKPEYASHIQQGITHDNPTQAFRIILTELSEKKPVTVANSATIAQTANLGDHVSIAENVVIEDNVVLGAGCYIGSNSYIGQGCHIGKGTAIGHNVTIHHDCHIGDDCVIADGAVIGGQGFGFSFEGGQWAAIPQVGGVKIGNNVHIGSNSCVDRGAIENTVIGNNVIIDNLVHIAHNVKIGEGTAMAACVGVAGSTTIGKYCLLAGQVGVAGHISICDGVQINGGAKVLKSIKKSGVYAGSFTALPVSQWNRITVYVKKIESLFKREK